MGSPIKSNAFSLYVQEVPGQEPIYLGEIDERCTNLDSIPSPEGSASAIVCVDGLGKLKIVGETIGAPDLISFSVENLLKPSVSYMERLKSRGCNFVFHALASCGGKAGVFSNWIRAFSLYPTRIENSTVGTIAQRDATDPSTFMFDMQSRPPRYDAWSITAGQKTTTEAQDANTIHSYVIKNCGDECGTPKDVCDTMVIGVDCNTGVTAANVLFSFDGGNTWAAGAQDPYAALTVNVVSARMFQVGANTVRTLVVRSTLAATALQAAYTDDYGATAWTTLVNIGSTLAEAALGHGALEVLNESNIWVGTDAGNIYKSTNGGATWAVQSSAITANGGSDVYQVRFLDNDFGVAGCAAGIVIYTVDGGDNWAAATTVVTGAGEVLTIHPFTRFRWIVGTDDGEIFQTWDGGTTWVEMTNFTGTGTGNIESMTFVNDLDGFAAHTDAGAVGRLLRTIDGGYSWIRVEPTTFATAGLNAVYACDINRVFAVGDDDGATAVIAAAGD